MCPIALVHRWLPSYNWLQFCNPLVRQLKTYVILLRVAALAEFKDNNRKRQRSAKAQKTQWLLEWVQDRVQQMKADDEPISRDQIEPSVRIISRTKQN